MLKKESFCQDLEQIIYNSVSNANNRKFINAFNHIISENHNVIAGEINPYLFGVKKICEAPEQIIYWIAETMNLVLIQKPVDIESAFSNQEIIKYKKEKKELSTVKQKYPIRFEGVTQVNTDQWYCVVSADMIMELYNVQLVNYNKNTQRPATVKEKNGLVEYKITVNQNSVNEIADLMKKHLFISNPITFNLNMDNDNTSFDFHDNVLTLLSGQFEIADGYHRYKAIIKNKQEDPNFQYSCILNIVNFTEEKACNFIGQESKRNKISKTVIQSMDSTNLTNVLIQRMNDDSRSVLYGLIGRQANDKYNFVWLFDIMSYLIKIQDRNQINTWLKRIRVVFNELAEHSLIVSDFISLSVIFYYISLDLEDEETVTKIIQMLPHKDEIIQKKKMSKVVVNSIMKLEKEV